MADQYEVLQKWEEQSYAFVCTFTFYSINSSPFSGLKDKVTSEPVVMAAPPEAGEVRQRRKMFPPEVGGGGGERAKVEDAKTPPSPPRDKRPGQTAAAGAAKDVRSSVQREMNDPKEDEEAAEAAEIKKVLVDQVGKNSEQVEQSFGLPHFIAFTISETDMTNDDFLTRRCRRRWRRGARCRPRKTCSP